MLRLHNFWIKDSTVDVLQVSEYVRSFEYAGVLNKLVFQIRQFFLGMYNSKNI